ncbi:MAG: efflux RND transporter periplasmic adaptor subunit [Anaerolineales bacterium]|nr:efflux RND transporter periplasmic adaptor subunit [Anaerolineales bacterium]
MNILKRIPLLLGMAAALLAGCSGQAEPSAGAAPLVGPLPVISEGHVVPADALYLAFPARGRVEQVLVVEGQRVRQGQLLIRLADRQQAEASLAAAQLALEQARQDQEAFTRTATLARAVAWQAFMDAQAARAAAEQRWEALDLDGIDDRLADAEAEARDRQQDLDDAQDTFDRYADLDPDNASRQRAEDDLERAQEDFNAAMRQLEAVARQRDAVRANLDLALAAEAEAQRAYEATRDGPDPEQLALLAARLANAGAQVAAAENALANYELTAPFAGTVTEINLSVNEYVGPETWAVLIADLDTWYVETSDLTELEVVRIAEGQTVTVVADALPQVEMHGVVERIGQSFQVQGGDVLYRVRIRLTDADPQLRWGMTVEIEFPLDE